jgi:putative two-component system response regulator
MDLPPIDRSPAAPAAAGHDTRSTILVVDDTSANLAVMGELLSPHRRAGGQFGRARPGRRAPRPRPDLILLDIMMPGMDGYTAGAAACRPGHARHPGHFRDRHVGRRGRGARPEPGAVDYVAKPIRAAILLARVRTHLELKQARDRLRQQNETLEHEVQAHRGKRADQGRHLLALLAEKRDNETGNHLHRTQAYVELLIGQLRAHPRFAPALRPPTTA